MSEFMASMADFIPSVLIAVGGIVIGLLALLTSGNK